MSETKNKIDVLESLRGIAALSVALLHFNVGSILNMRFTYNAALMVDFFFVLSGFVIALNYQTRIRNFNALVSFQLRRFFRLYPLHIVTLIIFVVIEFMKFIAMNRFGLDPYQEPFLKNNLTSFIANLFLAQNLVLSEHTWNTPSWSISAEFFTYILFGMFMVLSRGSLVKIIFVSLTFVVFSYIYLVNQFEVLPHYGIVSCFYSFFIGVLIYNLHNSCNFKIPSIISYLLFLISVILVIYSDEFPLHEYWLIPLAFAGLIISLVKSESKNFLIYLLDRKFLIYLGTISYGIYMIHMALWWLITQIFLIFFNFKTEVFINDIYYSIYIENIFISNLLILVGLTILFLLSHLSYKYIEMPMNNFRYKFAKFQEK